MKVAHTAIMMILGIVLPLIVQLWDRRRLSTEQRNHLWNFATWGAALYAFGPASMLGWIFVTRDKWRRCLVAPLWTVPLIFALWAADGLLAWQLQGKPFEVEPWELLRLAVVLAIAIGWLMLEIELGIRLVSKWRQTRRWRRCLWAASWVLPMQLIALAAAGVSVWLLSDEPVAVPLAPVLTLLVVAAIVIVLGALLLEIVASLCRVVGNKSE